MVRLPTSIDEIDADWLTEVLSPGRPGLLVKHCDITEVIRGACTKVRIGLDTNVPDFPTSLLMKAGFEQHSPHMRGMHVNEYHAYNDLVPRVSLNAPTCHFAGCDDVGNALVILEDLDLQPVRFLSLQEPIGFDLAADFLRDLAVFHSATWNSVGLTDGTFSWVPETGEADFAHYFDLLLTEEKFTTFAASPRGAAMPRYLLDPHRIRAAHAAMRQQLASQPQVINHGDMHLGNLYLDKHEKPGFLDMQPRLGAWSIDVSYFIVAGLDLIDRRKHEELLLQVYLDQLKSLAVAAPTFESAWLAYRQSVVWGLLIWLLNGSNFQTEANNTAAATRFAMAMVDHDTFDLLEGGRK